MGTAELSQRTTVNIQEKANLIWAIADNYRSYLNHFSTNVIDVIEKFEFDKEITKLSNNGILYNVIAELIAIKQSKIDSLIEYKKSIIYEYVTGKKEVTQ